MSCPATTCTMYRRPSNLLLAFGGHYEGKNHRNIDRQNEMDSCIKWMRPSSLQDLGYTTAYYTYGALCPTFPQLFYDKKALTVSAKSNVRSWTILLDHVVLSIRECSSFPFILNMVLMFVLFQRNKQEGRKCLIPGTRV